MHIRFLCALAALSIPAVSSTGCATATDPAKLSYFKPEDYRLEFLDPEKTSSMLATSVSDKAKNVVDFADQRLEPALAAVPAPAPTIIKLAIKTAKPILMGALQAQIKKSIEEHQDDVNRVVQKYNVFKDPELGYELLDEGTGDAKPTINRVNGSLTKAYRTLRSLKVAHKMLGVAKVDAAAIKQKPDPAALAGIGIAILSVTDLTLNAIDEAKDLVPELQGMSSDVANQAQAQPLMALDLASPAAHLTGVTNDLITLPADAGGILTDVADLLGLFTGDPAAPAAAE